jgi:hypothetical protein
MRFLTRTTGEVWTPTPESIADTNVAWLMRPAGVGSYEALHAWSVQDREGYWAAAIERLGIRCRVPYDRVVNLSCGHQGDTACSRLSMTRRNPLPHDGVVPSCLRGLDLEYSKR